MEKVLHRNWWDTLEIRGGSILRLESEKSSWRKRFAETWMTSKQPHSLLDILSSPIWLSTWRTNILPICFVCTEFGTEISIVMKYITICMSLKIISKYYLLFIRLQRPREIKGFCHSFQQLINLFEETILTQWLRR